MLKKSHQTIIMQWHEFAFSENRSIRLLRHSAFWAGWWLYFSLCQYLYQVPPSGKLRPLYVTVGPHLVVKTFMLTMLFALATYLFMYLLLPLIINGKRWKSFLNIILLYAFLFSAAYWLFWTGIPLIDSFFGISRQLSYPTKFWPAVHFGLWESTKVIAAAGIIRYAKYWWLKQKESEQLEKEKIKGELQLLQAQVQPAFLLSSLENIYDRCKSQSPDAPQMLLKLSELLSYMLYECDEPLVPLNKELEMMRRYIELETSRIDGKIESCMNIHGTTSNKMIAPFLLFPFIENSFKHITGVSKRWLNMDVSIEGDIFILKLAHGLPGNNESDYFPDNSLQSIIKRLNLIYPQQHELKVSTEHEMLLVLLRINLVGNTVRPVNPGEDFLVRNESKPQPVSYAAP